MDLDPDILKQVNVTGAPGSFWERLSKGADRAWLIMRRYVVHMLASA